MSAMLVRRLWRGRDNRGLASSPRMMRSAPLRGRMGRMLAALLLACALLGFMRPRDTSPGAHSAQAQSREQLGPPAGQVSEPAVPGPSGASPVEGEGARENAGTGPEQPHLDSGAGGSTNEQLVNLILGEIARRSGTNTSAEMDLEGGTINPKPTDANEGILQTAKDLALRVSREGQVLQAVVQRIRIDAQSLEALVEEQPLAHGDSSQDSSAAALSPAAAAVLQDAAATSARTRSMAAEALREAQMELSGRRPGGRTGCMDQRDRVKPGKSESEVMSATQGEGQLLDTFLPFRTPSRFLDWQPRPHRYLLALCSVGRLSNRIKCFRLYMGLAALLNRTLVIPAHDIAAPVTRYEYKWALDIPHARRCLSGTASLLTTASRAKPKANLASHQEMRDPAARANAGAADMSASDGGGGASRNAVLAGGLGQLWESLEGSSDEDEDSKPGRSLKSLGTLGIRGASRALLAFFSGSTASVVPPIVSFDEYLQLEGETSMRVKLICLWSGKAPYGWCGFRHGCLQPVKVHPRLALAGAWCTQGTLPRNPTLGRFLGAYGHLEDPVLSFGSVNYLGFSNMDFLTAGVNGPFRLHPPCQLLIQADGAVQRTAEQVVRLALGPTFLAVHLRRGDFITYCQKGGTRRRLGHQGCHHPLAQVARCVADRLNAMAPGDITTVFLATDAADWEIALLRSALDAQVARPRPVLLLRDLVYREQVKAVRDSHWVGKAQVMAATEAHVAALARVFLGTAGSTFTEEIVRMRRAWGLGSCFDNFICAGEDSFSASSLPSQLSVGQHRRTESSSSNQQQGQQLEGAQLLQSQPVAAAGAAQDDEQEARVAAEAEAEEKESAGAGQGGRGSWQGDGGSAQGFGGAQQRIDGAAADDSANAGAKGKAQEQRAASGRGLNAAQHRRGRSRKRRKERQHHDRQGGGTRDSLAGWQTASWLESGE